jgi:hypothetical protein
MFRHRILVTVSAALWTLVAFVADAGAITLDVTALPLPHALCPGATNAVPNDGISDQSAFNCAVALISTSAVNPVDYRGTIYVRAGTFNLTNPVVMTDRHVTIRGEGQRISRMVWNNSGDGLYFQSTSTTLNFTLSVRSISLLKCTPPESGCVSPAGGAAIRGIWDPAGTHWDHGIITTVLNDVHIGTTLWPSASSYWDFGMQLRNVTTAKISMFNIQGASASNGIAGIQIEAAASPTGVQHSIGVQIRNGTVTKYVRGIEVKDHSEGIHIQDVAIREASWGIQFITGLGTSFSNNYISARHVGIELVESSGVAITNNVIQQFENTDFVGINLNNAGTTRVIGNSIHTTSAAASRIGVLLQNLTSHCTVEGNITKSMTTGIQITGAVAQWNVLMANINSNAVTPWINGGWPGTNFFANNHQ